LLSPERYACPRFVHRQVHSTHSLRWIPSPMSILMAPKWTRRAKRPDRREEVPPGCDSRSKRARRPEKDRTKKTAPTGTLSLGSRRRAGRVAADGSAPRQGHESAKDGEESSQTVRSSSDSRRKEHRSGEDLNPRLALAHADSVAAAGSGVVSVMPAGTSAGRARLSRTTAAS